jgi:hypothetical protein
MALGDPPIRPKPPPPPKPGEFVLKPVEGKPHLKRDQHGNLHTVPTCSFCGKLTCTDYACIKHGDHYYP